MEKYIFNKYRYFDILVKINTLYCPNNNMLRDDSFYEFFDMILKKLFYSVKFSQDLDYILETLLNTVGVIWLLQPFFDGNTRTLNTFINLFLKVLGYNASLNEQDIKNIIPIFYATNETCSEKHILYLKKIITKKSQY